MLAERSRPAQIARLKSSIAFVHPVSLILGRYLAVLSAFA
jgi:hypothetical protein